MNLLLMLVASLVLTNSFFTMANAQTIRVPEFMQEYKSKAFYKCSNKAACDKAFSLTKVYISRNSDMKIQQSDDIIVSTYNPSASMIGITAEKEPGNGDSAVISINVFCGDIGDVQEIEPSGNENVVEAAENAISKQYACFKRMADVYEGFRPYLESNLKKKTSRKTATNRGT